MSIKSRVKKLYLVVFWRRYPGGHMEFTAQGAYPTKKEALATAGLFYNASVHKIYVLIGEDKSP